MPRNKVPKAERERGRERGKEEREEGRKEGETELTYIGCCTLPQPTLLRQCTPPPANGCLGHPSIPSPGKMPWPRGGPIHPLPCSASNCLLGANFALALPLGTGQRLSPSSKTTSCTFPVPDQCFSHSSSEYATQ